MDSPTPPPRAVLLSRLSLEARRGPAPPLSPPPPALPTPPASPASPPPQRRSTSRRSFDDPERLRGELRALEAAHRLAHADLEAALSRAKDSAARTDRAEAALKRERAKRRTLERRIAALEDALQRRTLGLLSRRGLGQRCLAEEFVRRSRDVRFLAENHPDEENEDYEGRTGSPPGSDPDGEGEDGSDDGEDSEADGDPPLADDIRPMPATSLLLSAVRMSLDRARSVRTSSVAGDAPRTPDVPLPGGPAPVAEKGPPAVEYEFNEAFRAPDKAEEGKKGKGKGLWSWLSG